MNYNVYIIDAHSYNVYVYWFIPNENHCFGSLK